jgi:hypothetical protein
MFLDHWLRATNASEKTPAASRSLVPDGRAASPSGTIERVKPPEVPPQPKLEAIPQEPSLKEVITPRPWESVVRIKLHTGDPGVLYGSGVVIESNPNGAWVLTSAHDLRLSKLVQFRMGEVNNGAWTYVPLDYSQGKITVDLFDGFLVGHSPAQVGCVERDLPAHFVAADAAADLALLRIETKRRLPASPLVEASWKPVEGVGMITLGCSEGNDATAWNTTILDPAVPLKSTLGATVVIKCEHRPRDGRAGGGLFTLDGRLAGINTYADPAAQAGLYAIPGAIRKLLRENGLHEVAGQVGDDDPKPVPSEPLLKSKLFQPTPADRLQAKLPPTATGPEPPPAKPSADDRRRIDELEQKLDQVLKALEGLKADKKSE